MTEWKKKVIGEVMDKKKLSFNDWLMKRTGLLIVYAWVMLAVGFFVLTAWDMSYLENSEQYVSILAIIGGPALLIITKTLDSWNQEKQNQISDYEAQAQHERAMDEIRVRHEADMERNPHCDKQEATDSLQDVKIQSLEQKLSNSLDKVADLESEIIALKNKNK
jgi:ABC-type nickel/cobalt efflux system permease component RcnA